MGSGDALKHDRCAGPTPLASVAGMVRSIQVGNDGNGSGAASIVVFRSMAEVACYWRMASATCKTFKRAHRGAARTRVSKTTGDGAGIRTLRMGWNTRHDRWGRSSVWRLQSCGDAVAGWS